MATRCIHIFHCAFPFQSTPPTRVATLPGQLLRLRFGFQSTPPTRVATLSQCETVIGLNISIHATHTGGDLREIQPCCWRFLFQSTPPTRVATDTAKNRNARYKFQSTPPTRVATQKYPQLLLRIQISIHATHTGGDPSIMCPSSCAIVFQSTPPTRVATAKIHKINSIIIMIGCQILYIFAILLFFLSVNNKKKYSYIGANQVSF